MEALIFDGHAVAALVAAVGLELRHRRRAGNVQVAERGPEGPVTTADLHAQEMLISGLTSQFGPALFIAEEGSYRLTPLHSDTSAWIIDPLDGTSGYLAGSDRYGVQVAALSQGQLAGAWICCPDLGWNLSAWEGSPLHVDIAAEVDGAGERILIADGDFDPHHLDFLRERGTVAYRRSASCAADYCDVVTGQLDLALYRRTHPWDHAPGAYLVSRAGGRSVRWNGTPYHPADRSEGILTVAGGLDPENLRARLLP